MHDGSHCLKFHYARLLRTARLLGNSEYFKTVAVHIDYHDMRVVWRWGWRQNRKGYFSESEYQNLQGVRDPPQDQSLFAQDDGNLTTPIYFSKPQSCLSLRSNGAIQIRRPRSSCRRQQIASNVTSYIISSTYILATPLFCTSVCRLCTAKPVNLGG